MSGPNYLQDQHTVYCLEPYCLLLIIFSARFKHKLRILRSCLLSHDAPFCSINAETTSVRAHSRSNGDLRPQKPFDGKRRCALLRICRTFSGGPVERQPISGAAGARFVVAKRLVGRLLTGANSRPAQQEPLAAACRTSRKMYKPWHFREKGDKYFDAEFAKLSYHY